MFGRRRTIRVYLAFSILLVLFAVAGCGPGPQPTPTLSPVALVLDVNPNVKEIEAGTTVGIVARVATGEAASLRWSVTGNSGGKVSPETGDAVFYTAGNPGVDIVTAEGTTAKGALVKERVSFNVVPASRPSPVLPTATPVPPVVTPVSPTATPPPAQAPTPTPQPPTPGAITLTSLTDGQSVPCENLAKGTYPLDLKDRIWPVVYIGGRFHPQDDGGKAPPMVNGNWYATVRFGDCTKPPEYDRGKTFQLIIVTANDAANKAFEDYIAKGQATGTWPGMVSPPEGAKEHLRIVVIRQ